MLKFLNSITAPTFMDIRLQAQYQIFKGAGLPFELENRECKVTLAPGEAIVKVILATICGSDLHTVAGHRTEDTPCILGHEGVGEIIEVHDRRGFSVGDRVSWTIGDSCGECSACTTYMLPEKCDLLFKYGHASLAKGSGLNGCYSTHIHIRKGTHMVKLPDEITPTIAAPANCALATMVNAVSQTTTVPKKAVVQGGGLLGVYACGLLKELGVSDIYCLEINERRFSLIKDFGGIPVHAKNPEKAIAHILHRSGDGVDAVFEVAGKKELIPQGLQLLRPGGDYVLVGLVHPDSDMGVTAEDLIRKCIRIKGVHNYAPWHLDEAIAFLERNKGQLPFEALISPPFRLEEIHDALEEAKKQKWMRVAIQP